jgi:integrase
MDRRTRPFSLYKRAATRGKPTYYAKIRDPHTGKYSRTVSTGETTKIGAERWTRDFMAQEAEREAREAVERSRVTVATVAAGFWDQSGHYAESRRVRGYPVSNSHLDIQKGCTNNHILPQWGAVDVSEITAGAVDRWVLDLHRSGKLAPGTVNKLLQCFRSILDGAVSLGYIGDNPAANVKPVRAVPRARGVLTDDEVRRLLRWPGPWTDYRHYAINLTAFTTGARIGELRALHVEDVHPDRVEIVRSWEEGYGLKPPKYNSVRAVPISSDVYNVLQTVIQTYRPTTLLFYGATGNDRPMSKSHIEGQLRRALVRMMTPEDTPPDKLESVQETVVSEIRERNIGVHSWRHKLNTVLRSAGVPDSKIRLLTGHRGESMTNHYTRYASADFTDVRTVQTTLLGAVS